MVNLDLSKIKKVFFVGIGGIGISAIARMMLLEGKEVFGSDISMSGITDELEKLGAKIVLGQAMELIPKDIELVIYSISITKYDPEFFKKLQNSNIQMLSYPETLGIVTANKYTIAVSGTHGKTTTTAMIGKVLIEANKDPSVIVGSLLKESKSNLIVGKSEYFVVEACEYERSFLNIKPKILVITNIEADHLDYYKDLADIESAFRDMAMQTDDFIVCNLSDVATSNILKKESKEKYRAKVVNYLEYLEKVPQLSVPGVHNRMDAACAMAVADILNIEEEVAQKALSEFSGTWRRLEKKGVTKEGAIVYDDYAHHPTEVKASLEALRELYPKGDKNITVLFQPHLYSRTKALFDEFVTCFDDADNVFLLPIFFARENPDPDISSDKLATAIRNHKGEATAFKDFETAEDYVRNLKLGEKDVFITMGAGEAYKVAEEVFKLV
ncbi:MAG: UDP-N-acetylmuramate--L-alanine ligase [Candidatus Paceibacterota bacterium]|jgi:UDP-N-acetylmuramate--alanine ligase